MLFRSVKSAESLKAAIVSAQGAVWPQVDGTADTGYSGTRAADLKAESFLGLRKAIGATPRDILLQFLVEAVSITFLGGLTGMALAGIISWLISTWVHWKTVITLGSLLLAFFFSVTGGIVFGLWPAGQASELEPIKALRYE